MKNYRTLRLERLEPLLEKYKELVAQIEEMVMSPQYSASNDSVVSNYRSFSLTRTTVQEAAELIMFINEYAWISEIPVRATSDLYERSPNRVTILVVEQFPAVGK